MKHTLRLAFLTSPLGPDWREVWKARLLLTAVTFGVYIVLAIIALIVGELS